MTVAGGRESLARMALMAVGVAVGVPLILVALSALPIMQSHIDRLAWHRTTAASPPTAPDHALWLAVTDRYAGRDIIRLHVAALGPRPPRPSGPMVPDTSPVKPFRCCSGYRLHRSGRTDRSEEHT